MATINENFFKELANGTTWSAGVAFKRTNALPLDRYSVFESLEAAIEYTSNAVAYPGQLIAVVENDTMVVYVLTAGEEKLNLKPVGTIPSGDNKTIEVTAEGVIGLLGAATAENGSLPMLDAETGTLVWKTLEAIGAGDGNDNTTYDFSFEGKKVIITPKFNGVANEDETIELDFSSYVQKQELGLKREDGYVRLTINNEVVGEFSEADFVKDSVLEDVTYDSEKQEIIFTWKTEGGETKTDAVSVADFVHTYLAGNGLELVDNKFSVKLDSDSESFLTVNESGLKLSGVQSAINTAKQDVLSEIENKNYATSDELNEVSSVAEKAATDAAEATATAKATESKLNDLINGGGEPNVIEHIKVNGVAQTVNEKTVDLTIPTKLSDLGKLSDLEDYANIDKRISDAQTSANNAQFAANSNKSLIDGLDARVLETEKTLLDHEDRIDYLENYNNTHETHYLTISSTVNTHTAILSSLNANYVSSSEFAELKGKVGSNEGNIKTINTTITTIGEQLNDKVNRDTVAQMVQNATYDDTPIRALIKANEDAITTEKSRAQGVEDSIIARLNSVSNVMDFKGVLSEMPTDNSLYKNGDVIIVDTVEYVFDGIEWQAFGDASVTGAQITSLTNDINNIKDTLIPNAISVANEYTNQQIAGLPAAMVDNSSIIVDNNGVISVGEVSTDNLIQGNDVLILNGGTSSTNVN